MNSQRASRLWKIDGRRNCARLDWQVIKGSRETLQSVPLGPPWPHSSCAQWSFQCWLFNKFNDCQRPQMNVLKNCGGTPSQNPFFAFILSDVRVSLFPSQSAPYFLFSFVLPILLICFDPSATLKARQIIPSSASPTAPAQILKASLAMPSVPSWLSLMLDLHPNLQLSHRARQHANISFFLASMKGKTPACQQVKHWLVALRLSQQHHRLKQAAFISFGPHGRACASWRALSWTHKLKFWPRPREGEDARSVWKLFENVTSTVKRRSDFMQWFLWNQDEDGWGDVRVSIWQQSAKSYNLSRLIFRIRHQIIWL